MSISVPAKPAQKTKELFYPESDDKPMAETGIHVLVLFNLIGQLRSYFHGQRVYVIGNMFLYWHEGKPKKRRAPDIMVIKDVDPTFERRSFKIWEEKATPCFILEATSASTVDIDLEVKHDLYEELGVGEYFLFDPFGEDLAAPLCGFRLVNAEYEALTPEADGSLLSEELGLKFIPNGNELIVLDPKTGQRLPTIDEFGAIAQRLQREVQNALDDNARMKQQIALADWKEQEAWQQAEKEKETMAAEIERLKKLLQQKTGSANGSASQP